MSRIQTLRLDLYWPQCLFISFNSLEVDTWGNCCCFQLVSIDIAGWIQESTLYFRQRRSGCTVLCIAFYRNGFPPLLFTKFCFDYVRPRAYPTYSLRYKACSSHLWSKKKSLLCGNIQMLTGCNWVILKRRIWWSRWRDYVYFMLVIFGKLISSMIFYVF